MYRPAHSAAMALEAILQMKGQRRVPVRVAAHHTARHVVAAGIGTLHGSNASERLEDVGLNVGDVQRAHDDATVVIS